MEDNEQENSYDLSALEFGVAGASSGIITRFMVHPLDVLKIRFQLQITPISPSAPSKYTSVYQAVRVIVREEGFRAMWKGHIPAQYLSVVFGAIQFSTYEKISKYLSAKSHQNYPKFERMVSVCSGFASGFTSTVFSFPFDVIRTHLVFQGEPKVYKGTMDAASQIYKRDGLRGFTKGLGAACLQTAPMSALMFGFREVFSTCWVLFFQTGANQTEVLSTTGSLITGFMAGLSAKTLTYPCDLVKKRLQIQGFDEKKSYCKQIIKCRGIIQCFLLTVKNEGFLGLYKGFTPSLLKAGANTALYFTVYDKVCQFILYTKR